MSSRQSGGSLFPYPTPLSYTATSPQAACRGGWVSHTSGVEEALALMPTLALPLTHSLSFVLLYVAQYECRDSLFQSNLTCIRVWKTIADNNPVTSSAPNQGARQHPSSSHSSHSSTSPVLNPLTNSRKGITFPLGGPVLRNKPHWLWGR